jgi:hypothetical protein
VGVTKEMVSFPLGVVPGCRLGCKNGKKGDLNRKNRNDSAQEIHVVSGISGFFFDLPRPDKREVGSGPAVATPSSVAFGSNLPRPTVGTRNPVWSYEIRRVFFPVCLRTPWA